MSLEDGIIFHNISQGDLGLDDVIKAIKLFLEENPKAEYTMVIGSDSQEKVEESGEKSLNLITAIVVHRKGFGGRYFWQRQHKTKIHSLREKIYTETLASLECATKFVPLLKKALNGNIPTYHLEIHVDVGEHGATRDMIKEVVGMVTGNGFVAKTKPESFGASHIADKHT